jgi:hypothetical protein
MNNMNKVAIFVIIAVVLAVVAILLFVRDRSRKLRSRFGPEYDRAVEEAGSRFRGEQRLEKLEKRVEKFSIHPLDPEAASRFRASWVAIQARFVDDPKSAVADADRLLAEVMTARGYPVSDFEQRAAEISVNHAAVVEHYRAGHDIALRHAQGKASTEDLRQAVIHYRTLFDDLLGESEAARFKTAGSSS